MGVLANIITRLGAQLAGRGLTWDQAKIAAQQEALVTPETLLHAEKAFGPRA